MKRDASISKKITAFIFAVILSVLCVLESPSLTMASEDTDVSYEEETEIYESYDDAETLEDSDAVPTDTDELIIDTDEEATESDTDAENVTEGESGEATDAITSDSSSEIYEEDKEDTSLDAKTSDKEETSLDAKTSDKEDASLDAKTSNMGNSSGNDDSTENEGQKEPTSDLSDTVKKPDTPSITKAVNAANAVKVIWTSVSNSDGYFVLRSENGSAFEKIKTVKSSKTVSFYDYSAVNDGSKYSYIIRAYVLNDDIYTESDDSDEVSIYRLNRPLKSSAKNLTSGGIDVNWKSTASADGYNIYRSVNGGEYEFLKTRNGNLNTSYIDKTATENGAVYRYRVSAFKKSDGIKYESSLSNIMIACGFKTVDVKSITNPGYKQIRVSWKKNAAADGYRITLRKGSASKNIYIPGSSTTSTIINVKSATGTYESFVCSYKIVKRAGLSDVKRYSAKGSSKTITLQKNILTVAVSDSAMTIRLKNTNPSYTDLKAAVWSSERGQDDLVWQSLSYISDGYYKVKLSPSLFKSRGTFYIHIYNGNNFVTGAAAIWNTENIGYKNMQLITLDKDWLYADHTSINSGAAVFYRASSNRNGIIVAINAGHGTNGCYNYYNLSHPDGTPKVTGGSTAEGAVWTVCDNYGMTFNDGVSENYVVLNVAGLLRNKLLAMGYDVLMLRNDVDSQLDVISRTVIANNIADCHISLHYDGDGLMYDKGVFYCSVPDGIKGMYPVSTIWQRNDHLGDCLIAGMENAGIGIFSERKIATDLMQTSYSTIPSVDIELGNQCSAHDVGTLSWYANGLAAGVDLFFS